MTRYNLARVVLIIAYLMLILYSVAIVYIAVDYHEGILNKDSGIFRHLFIIGITLSIMGVSSIPFTASEKTLRSGLEKWKTIAKGWQEIAYEYRNVNYSGDWVSQIDDYVENVSSRPNYNKNHGIIYFVQREDGIYKIGRTDNLRKRLLQLYEDYNQKFTPIKAWYVEDCSRYEKYALRITKDCVYTEENRKELRKFTPAESNLFILAFDKVVKYGE